MRRTAVAVFVLSLGAALAALPAAALTLGPGQGIEVPFSLTAPATGADTLTFNLVGVTAVGVSGLTIELYDGATLLGSAALVPVTEAVGFIDAGSDWSLNPASADLSSVRDGTIAGRIRVLPDFGPGGTLTAQVSPVTSLMVGLGTDDASLTPFAGVVSVGEAFLVPEPGALGLLAVASLVRRRGPR